MLRVQTALSAGLRGAPLVPGAIPAVVIVSCAFALMLLGPSRAHAFRTFADDPDVAARARWDSAEVRWEVSGDGLDDAPVESAALLNALDAALRTLSGTTCPLPALRNEGIVAGTAAAAGDGRNSITIVTTDWAARGFPAGAGATTDVQIERRTQADGAETTVIVEADVYLNHADYTFVTAGATADVLDLQAVLTHELLHGLGLLHNCEHDGAGGAPVCGPEHRSSAVYPTYLGATARDISVDDVDGLCWLYAATQGGCDRSCPEGTTCVTGECVEAGEPGCDADRSCREGTCALAGNNEGFCVAEGSTGTPCEQGVDCDSRLCVSSSTTAYCTHECTYDDQCAGMQHCAQIGDRRVCAPLSGAAGCGVAPGGNRSLPTWLIAILWIARSRRRREAPR